MTLTRAAWIETDAVTNLDGSSKVAAHTGRVD